MLFTSLTNHNEENLLHNNKRPINFLNLLEIFGAVQAAECCQSGQSFLDLQGRVMCGSMI